MRFAPGFWNSCPATMYTFSLVFPYKKAFPISAAQMSRWFMAAIRNPIRTVSIPTTPEYMSSLGGSVRCPPATSLAFLLRSNLTSNIIWYGIHLYPAGNSCSDTSRNIWYSLVCFNSTSMAVIIHLI